MKLGNTFAIFGSNDKLFADDTSLFIIADYPVIAADCINNDLGRLTQWAATWLVSFNHTKKKNRIRVNFAQIKQKQHPPLFKLNQQIIEVDAHKHLGLIVSKDCSWHEHIISEKAWTRMNIMHKLKFEFDRKFLETIYIVFIQPLLEYDVICDNCTQYQKEKKLTKYKTRPLENLEQRRKNHRLTLFYEMKPLYICLL